MAVSFVGSGSNDEATQRSARGQPASAWWLDAKLVLELGGKRNALELIWSQADLALQIAHGVVLQFLLAEQLCESLTVGRLGASVS